MRFVVLAVALALAACVSNPSPPIGKAVPRLSPPSPPPTAIVPPQQVAPPPSDSPEAGLLLPLSGANEKLGRNLLHAAEMALLESPPSLLRLVPIDTGRGAISLDSGSGGSGAILLGPIFSTETKQLGHPAVPVLALTNDSSAARPGVYVLGVTPEMQMNRVLSYALSQGLRHYAALLPDTPYGHVISSSMEKTLGQGGGSILQTVFYAPDSSDFTVPVQRLADVYRAQPFEALVLPEGGTRGATLAGQVRRLGMSADKVRLIGSGLWQTADADPALAGGWYAATPPERQQSFMRRYQQIYGEAADPRGLLLYDAVSLAAAMSRSAITPAELETRDGYSGLSGLFRLEPSGAVERGLAILEATPQGAHVRDAAPERFPAPAS
ncbi:MAG TPA: penicillin-binding protein activator [Dongiaceae bacterium]|nr:penicillin-binding protein activator [Dongiaceae bacterium]